MFDWKSAEKEIARITGGKLTPGSGNKSIKGDIIVDKDGSRLVIEVKHTNKSRHTLKRAWFDKLERIFLKERTEVALALFFEKEIYLYYFRYTIKDEEAYNFNNVTCVVTKESLPITIQTTNGCWELEDWQSLSDKNL